MDVGHIGHDRDTLYNSNNGVLGYWFGTSNPGTGFYAVAAYTTNYLPISLTNIIVRGGYLDQRVFQNCQYIKDINVIATKSTIIYGYTFQSCKRMTDVALPANPITRIDMPAFYDCGSLVNMTLPFAGYQRDSATTGVQSLFGYIFGTTSYTGSREICQAYNYNSNAPANRNINTYNSSYNYRYYIPTSLKKIVILGGNVAWGTFSNLVDVKEIILPNAFYTDNGNTNTLRYTFYGCINLERVYIPTSTIDNITEYTFGGCYRLKEVTLPFLGYQRNYTSNNNNAAFSYVFQQSYYNESNTPSSYYYTDAKGWRVPKSLAKITILGNSNIYNSAFDGLKYVKEINLPNQYNDTTIHDYAFRNCTSLTSFTIPSGFTAIGNYAFENTGIVNVEIPSNITSIGNYAFQKSAATQTFHMGANVATVGTGAFTDSSSIAEVLCDSLGIWQKINFANGTANPLHLGAELKILDGSDYQTVVDLTLDESSPVIGTYAFYGYIYLDSLTVPDIITTIGAHAFENCLSLMTVHMGNGVTTVGADAFLDSESIYEVYTNNLSAWAKINFANPMANPTYWARGIMYGGDQLTELELPYDEVNTVKIGTYAFTNCDMFTSVIIPDSVNSIGIGAFHGCGGIQSITLPFIGASKTATSASASTVFGYIFGNIDYMGSVAVNQGVGIYYLPDQLSYVNITGGNILDNAFNNCSLINRIILPENTHSSNTIGASAFANCSGLSEITIPSTITSISANAFLNCSNIEDVYVYNPPVSKPWVSLGSEKEIEEESVQESGKPRRAQGIYRAVGAISSSY